MVTLTLSIKRRILKLLLRGQEFWVLEPWYGTSLGEWIVRIQTSFAPLQNSRILLVVKSLGIHTHTHTYVWAYIDIYQHICVCICAADVMQLSKCDYFPSSPRLKSHNILKLNSKYFHHHKCRHFSCVSNLFCLFVCFCFYLFIYLFIYFTNFSLRSSSAGLD